jgi:hypothetical protein
MQKFQINISCFKYHYQSMIFSFWSWHFAFCCWCYNLGSICVFYELHRFMLFYLWWKISFLFIWVFGKQQKIKLIILKLRKHKFFSSCPHPPYTPRRSKTKVWTRRRKRQNFFIVWFISNYTILNNIK